jgi:RNA polymerase-interacting CarD/CdnL/TRCF family regulator
LQGWRFFFLIYIQEAAMVFCAGDSVMHWVHGLGKVIQLEQRDASGKEAMYYAVQIQDMTVWVPADGMLESRLRHPTQGADFGKLTKTLSKPGEPLPEDRHQRKLLLMEWLKDGRVESLFRVIRSLATFRKIRALNDNDQALMHRLQKMLIGEWGFAMSIPVVQAEIEFHSLLSPDFTGD